MTKGRALDHFIIWNDDFTELVALYKKLGFNVRPPARHIELGSQNAIIHFANTYLELIDFGNSPAWLQDPYEDFMRSSKGVPHVSLRSFDLEKDHHLAEQQNLSPGPILSARRKISMPDGAQNETASNCFYMWRKDNPYLSLFLSEHTKPETIFIEGFAHHANTVMDVHRLVYMSSDSQGDLLYFAKLFGRKPDHWAEDGFYIVGDRGDITEVLTPEAAVRRYGNALIRQTPDPLRGLCIALHFKVNSLRQCQDVLSQKDISTMSLRDSIFVPASETCGMVMGFEA